MAGKTIVTYLGKEDGGSSCGYCKSSDGFKAWGMWAYHMTVEDYQDLIDRGFRRSGHYVYKPVMHETCCPLYTIRNRAAECRVSPRHRRLLKQVANFLNTGQKPRSKPANPEEEDGARSQAATNSKSSTQAGAGDQVSPRPEKREKAAPDVKPGGDSQDAKPKDAKAKFKRWQLKQERLRSRAEREGTTFEALLEAYHERRRRRLEQHRQKTLEELLALAKPDGKHRLTCRLVRSAPRSDEYNATEDAEHDVYQKYQMSVHGDEASECTKRQFQRFLVESPLYEKEGAAASGFGSFHYQYWLDDRLIGVSVLDFLPFCVSSVYFFYDPEFSFLSLGTYSALREIAFTRELTAQDPDLRFYYLGFYVHSCRKMRYKGQYSASDLLCPETYQWRPIGPSRALLDQRKYSRLCADIHAQDDGTGQPEMCLLLWNGTIMPWDIYKQLTARSGGSGRRKSSKSSGDAEVVEYARLVGEKCARRMILVKER